LYGEPAQLCDAESSKIKGLSPLIVAQKFLFFIYKRFARETLNQSTFYGEPAQLCDAGSSKIKGWSP